jgi:hypothetical protein
MIPLHSARTLTPLSPSRSSPVGLSAMAQVAAWSSWGGEGGWNFKGEGGRKASPFPFEGNFPPPGLVARVRRSTLQGEGGVGVESAPWRLGPIP